MNNEKNGKKMRFGRLLLWMIILLCLVKICQSGCPSECSTCNPPTSNTCTACIDSYYLSISDCFLCNSVTAFGGMYCNTCNISKCLSCVSGAVLDTCKFNSDYFLSHPSNMCQLHNHY